MTIQWPTFLQPIQISPRKFGKNLSRWKNSSPEKLFLCLHCHPIGKSDDSAGRAIDRGNTVHVQVSRTDWMLKNIMKKGLRDIQMSLFSFFLSEYFRKSGARYRNQIIWWTLKWNRGCLSLHGPNFIIYPTTSRKQYRPVESVSYHMARKVIKVAD